MGALANPWIVSCLGYIYLRILYFYSISTRYLWKVVGGSLSPEWPCPGCVCLLGRQSARAFCITTMGFKVASKVKHNIKQPEQPRLTVRNHWSRGKRTAKLLLLLFFWPTSTKPVGTKTLNIWNNRLQRASWWWTCFEMRPHSPSAVPRTAAGTGRCTPWHRLSVA